MRPERFGIDAQLSQGADSPPAHETTAQGIADCRVAVDQDGRAPLLGKGYGRGASRRSGAEDQQSAHRIVSTQSLNGKTRFTSAPSTAAEANIGAHSSRR